MKKSKVETKEESGCEEECAWKYNFPSIPNKAICTKCYAKAELDLSTLEWFPVGEFKNDKRTDKELSEKWVH